ncbi:putative HC-toxin efflux carrier TOXA [Coleophoma cylindrospora]|uniref:Putative HC-toxin efflux carrier TOXA n=1 Tax=Coleophoma cylindrospora TaxID=1849047 RepID=A0A3D8QTG6_9HELO|nr:putative HC-toxin efflux carrier TOXA [Coleophoma cylindrospora]
MSSSLLAEDQSSQPEMENKERELSNPESETSQEKPDHVPENIAVAPPAAPEQQWISGLKLLPIMVAITLGVFLMLLDTSIMVTASTPALSASQFHSLPDVGWYGAAYQLACAVFQPLTGKFYYNFDTKWTFMAFMAVFELGSLLCGVATSSKMLIVGRAIAGLGSSGIMNGSYTIIACCVPMAKRPTLIGFLGGFAQFGLVIGPLIGGALTQYTTWRWCFYINLPVGGLLAALLVFSRVPEPMPKAPFMSALRTLLPKIDLIGFGLFAPAAVQLLLALQYGGNTYAWKSSQIIGLFCGAGVTFLLFLGWEHHKGDQSMIAFSMVRKQTVWSSCVMYGFFMGQLVCISYYLPIYFQGVKGASPTMSGVYILPVVISHVITGLFSGMLIGKVGYYLPFVIVGAAFVAIGNGLLSTLLPATSTGKWIGYQIIAGVGRGLALQVPVISVQNTVAPAQVPNAMAILMFSQAFAGALLLSICDTIFTNSLKTFIPRYAPAVNPQTIINAGATGFWALVSGEQRAGVLVAYSKSVDRVMYLMAGSAVGAFAAGWFMGFVDIRRKNQVSKA